MLAQGNLTGFFFPSLKAAALSKKTSGCRGFLGSDDVPKAII